MEYISSDTNVWFDFQVISMVHLPFRLDCTFVMYHEALRKEIIDPPELIETLRQNGLEEIDISTEEFYLAGELQGKYAKITGYDAIALSVAKSRGILLLTGDNALRKAAATEGVAYIGSIGIVDRLLDEKRITEEEYLNCLNGWKSSSAEGRRLPLNEIDKRINMHFEDIKEV